MGNLNVIPGIYKEIDLIFSCVLRILLKN